MRDWTEILQQLGVSQLHAAKWAPVFEEQLAGESVDFIRAFLPQVLHESARLKAVKESLNYSAERLCEVWPKRFPTLESATPFARNAAKLAERVYGGRMGNDEPGDAFKYIGRGLIQCTGRDNYELVQTLTGMPVVDKPELLEVPANALRSAIAWFKYKVPDTLWEHIRPVTRIVNGGHHGLTDREALAEKVQDIFTEA